MTYIYFLENHNGSAIKIGKSVNPTSRFRSLTMQADAMFGSNRINLLALIQEEDRRHEKRLHQRFGSHRLKGEWFLACAELREFISNIQSVPLPREAGRVVTVSMPADWWSALKELAHLREMQDDSPAKSFNAVALEAMAAGIQDIKLELLERQGRRA